MSSSKYKEIALLEETGSCLLCSSAPCTKDCPHGIEADRIIRSIRFGNYAGAKARLSDEAACFSCESRDCMKACLKGRINRPVPIDEIMQKLSLYERCPVKDIDLSVEFCGVQCENPFFLSSSIVGSNYEMVAKAFDMGWAGVAFKTIGTFVPDEVSPRFDAIRKEAVPFVGFKNIEQISDHTLDENLYFLKKLKTNYPNKVIVASIIGHNENEWTYLAKLMTEAGADIIECNFSCPHMAENGLGSDVGQNPELVAAYTKAVRRGTKLPVLAKMTPNLGNMQIPARAAIEAGATGIAAINTIKSLMNIDLKSFVSGPDVIGKSSIGGYSGKAVKPIALYFIHSLKNCDDFKAVPFSGMGGIENWCDAAEFLALGCENIQITTSVMQYGYRIIDDLIEGMKYYLGTSGYTSVSDIIGKALPNIISADDLERSSICYPRFDRTKCIGCGRCCISCYDGGHQALSQNGETGMPVMDAKKCVGCQLCAIICPVQAISQGVRVSKKSREEIAT